MENSNPWFIEGSSKARLVSVTPQAEEMIAYIARVTSKDQSNPKVDRLLNYCAKHGHFSVFEQASMTVEVVTPLAISIQGLRHRSFKFQQFSGRYESQEKMSSHTKDLPAFLDIFYLPSKARLQDTLNRQNSLFTDDLATTEFMRCKIKEAYEACFKAYRELLEAGIAKEMARFVIPEGVYTRMYITGDIRSFTHYIQVRDDEGVAQYEHCELARAIKTVYSTQFPTLYGVFFPEKSPDSVDKRDPLIDRLNQLNQEIRELKLLVTGSQTQP